jgi:hypothetical protein
MFSLRRPFLSSSVFHNSLHNNAFRPSGTPVTPVRFGYSRDAIEVKYRTNGMIGSVVISPKDKDTFLWDLTKALAGANVPSENPVTGS